jgi:hypothetical protein
LDGTYSLGMVGLGLSFACAAMPINILGQPEIMNAYPHCAEKFGQPLFLFLIVHRPMMAKTVLLLEISPRFEELTTKEVTPADSKLLLKQVLVAFWVKGRVNWFVTEEFKESFVDNIQ